MINFRRGAHGDQLPVAPYWIFKLGTTENEYIYFSYLWFYLGYFNDFGVVQSNVFKVRESEYGV